MKRLRDPFVGSVVVLLLMAAGGVAALVLGYRGLAATDDISIEVPYLVSGGLGGVGLLVFSLGLLAVQFRRKEAARERREIARLIEAFGE